MNSPKVIAISGASGSGKTTIIKELAKKFDCDFLLFDDHTSKNTYPTDMKSWFESGANVSDIKTPNLVTSLQRLRAVNNSRFIFIEEPFGKEREVISSLIDHVVLLDQPLEICLTRLIKRHLATANSRSFDSISSFVDKYEEYFRNIYKTCVNQVKDNCDLILNEVTSIDETVNIISDWLTNHISAKTTGFGINMTESTVKLRSFTDSDNELLVEYLNNSAVTKYITNAIPQPYSKEDAQWWIDNSKHSPYTKAIELNGILVGCISAKIGDFEYNCGAELGYWIANDFWNQGVATEAVRVFTEQLFTSSHLIRLFVSVVSCNIASIRVLEKNGYSLEGTLKKASFKHGEYFDEHLWSKIENRK